MPLMESGNERLFRVLGDVGSDLIATAEQKTFVRSPWKRILPAEACLLLAAGLSLAAMPYFRAPREMAAPSMKQDAVVEEYTAEMSTAESEGGGTAQEQPRTENTAMEAQPVQTKEQLVFWDTVYYVEAQYTREEASLVLGEYLGTVEQADTETLSGAAVYERVGSEVREDHKERQVPLEIFVENELGYLYCLTYYLSDDPLMEWEAVYYRYHAGKLDELMELFVFGLERNAALVDGYEDTPITADDLTGEQLLAFFKSTLEMEKYFGTRSEDLNQYLWKTETGYAVPVSDLKRQLDRYLTGYMLLPEKLPGYDPDLDAVNMETLVAEVSDIEFQIVPELCSLDEENKILYLTVSGQTDQDAGIQRTYQIGFDTGLPVYLQIDNTALEE